MLEIAQPEKKPVANKPMALPLRYKQALVYMRQDTCFEWIENREIIEERAGEILTLINVNGKDPEPITILGGFWRWTQS
jgi:hypothetical protein